MNSSKEESIEFVPIFFAKIQLWSFVYYITVTTVTVVANSLLMFAMLKDPLKCFRNATSIFIFHLAFSDLLNALMFMEEALLWLTKFGGVNGLPRPYQILNYVVFEVIFFSNMPTIFALALERCLGSVFPLWHKVNVTTTACYTWIAVMWLLGGVVVAIRLILLIYFRQQQIYFNVGKFSWGIFIAGTLICYSAAAITTRKRRLALKRDTAISEAAQKSAKVRLRNESRFLCTMFIIFLGFFLGVVPSMVSFWLFDVLVIAPTDEIIALLYNISDMVLLLNFALNTFIYLWRLPKYRRTFQVLYCNKGHGDPHHARSRHAQKQEMLAPK